MKKLLLATMSISFALPFITISCDNFNPELYKDKPLEQLKHFVKKFPGTLDKKIFNEKWADFYASDLEGLSKFDGSKKLPGEYAWCWFNTISYSNDFLIQWGRDKFFADKNWIKNRINKSFTKEIQSYIDSFSVIIKYNEKITTKEEILKFAKNHKYKKFDFSFIDLDNLKKIEVVRDKDKLTIKNILVSVELKYLDKYEELQYITSFRYINIEI